LEKKYAINAKMKTQYRHGFSLIIDYTLLNNYQEQAIILSDGTLVGTTVIPTSKTKNIQRFAIIHTA
jgi:hypothetical protein